MKVEIEKLPKKTIKLKITVPKERVREVYRLEEQAAAKEVEIKGFRKGKAPKELAKERLDREKIKEKALSKIIAEAYGQALKEHFLRPIANPRIELKEFDPDNDLVFSTTIVEKPDIDVGDYRRALKKLKEQKSAPLLGPDGRPIKNEDSKKGGISANAVLTQLKKTIKIEIPELLIEEEVKRMLARLVDQTARLGITVEEYLNSLGKTAEKLKEEYGKTAKDLLKGEFILLELAKKEGIKVEESEISATIKAAPDEKTREELLKPEGKTYVRSILLKNKTIQRLIEIAEGKN